MDSTKKRLLDAGWEYRSDDDVFFDPEQGGWYDIEPAFVLLRTRELNKSAGNELARLADMYTDMSKASDEVLKRMVYLTKIIARTGRPRKSTYQSPRT